MDVREKLIEILEKSFAKQYEKRYLLTAPHTAEDLIANGVTVQEWIPVKDRLPETDGDFLCWNDFYGCIVGHFWAKGKYFISKAVSVTHWMPLPEPPEERKGGEG